MISNDERKKRIHESIQLHREEYDNASDTIWDHPEINFHEDYSAEIIRELLRKNDFILEEDICGLPNAFRGVYGSGRPVLAFLGEFDALTALSQTAGCTTKSPIKEGAPGHGCGHNLLGIGALGAAIAIKELIASGDLDGTVVYIGCPAEETGSSKAFMARDGGFDGLDAILTWHPWDYTGIWPGGSLANVKMIFRFKGRAAHAAGSPHLGRSALDALELMNVGVQFLREHVPEDTRIHYAITDTGGHSPNVVQAHSEAVYLIRSPRVQDLKEIQERVVECARGAAIMTGTEMEMEFVKGCSNILANTVMEEMLLEIAEDLGVPSYTEEELAFARQMQEATSDPSDTLYLISRFSDARTRNAVLAHQGDAMYEFVAPHCITDTPIISVSTDVGDASWCAPTSQISVAAWPGGTPAHSWQAVAMGKTTIAHKAMHFASEVLANCGAQLMYDAEILKLAANEFQSRIKRQPYSCPIPDGVKPKY